MIRTLKQKLFSAPYPYLPWAVFLFFVLCNFYHPYSSIHTFALGDTDDYMRLNQVIAWIEGQSWYDLGHPRLSPGDNVIIPWSRLVDIPLALLVMTFKPFMKIQYAALLSSFIIPLALLGLLFIPTLTSMARPLISKNKANLIAVLFLFSPTLTRNFSAGRVDHHSYQIIIAAFGFLSLLRLYLCPKSYGYAVAAGFTFAAGLWIGGESLPSLTLFAGLLGLLAAGKGGTMLSKAALFGVTLSLASLLMLLIAKRPEAWLQLDMTWFSFAYVLYAFAIGGVTVLLWILGRHTKNSPLRLALYAALCFFAAMLYFLAVPKAFLGPYADMETLSQNLILDNVGEAQPLLKTLGISFSNLMPSTPQIPLTFRYLVAPLIGVLAAAYFAITRHGRQRKIWFLSLTYIILFAGLTLFWQLRTGTFFWLFILAPLTKLAWVWWKIIAEKYKGRPRFWMEILSFSALTFFPCLLVPYAVAQKPLYPDLILFPVPATKGSCNTDIVMEYLGSPKDYGGDVTTVLSTMNEGPELLFWTPHKVLSAPYNVRGNRDSYDFFSSRDDKQALKLLKNKQVGLVLVCRNISGFYATMDKRSAFNSTISVDMSTRNIDVLSNKEHPTLIERLIRKDIPSWLKPVEVFFNKDYLLFEVQTAAAASKTKPLHEVKK